MAWATMHFATGMCCAGAITSGGCLLVRRGWRWIPSAMTLGGLWAMIPDMPRFFRQDFPNAPFASILGHRQFESWLVEWGNVFFFHRALDNQPKEYALFGLALIIVLYNLTILFFMWHHAKAYRRLRRLAGQLAVPGQVLHARRWTGTPSGLLEDAQGKSDGSQVVARINTNTLPRAS